MQGTAHAAGTSTTHQGGPLEDPLEQASPRSRVHASLGRAPSRSRGCSSLERAPPRSRVRPALDRGPPRSRAPRTHTPAPRTRAFNALTPAGQSHHAPGARAPVPPHQLPRREPHPHHCGEGLCSAAGVSPVTPCACSSTANAPDPRRGAGRTLDLLSCDPTGLGGGARPVERHPCRCNSMAAVPARAGARQALQQQLQHCETHRNRTPLYQLLYSVRANVSSSLEPIRRYHHHPPPFYPRTTTVRVQSRP
jgi:hypothetical protein